MNVSDCCYFISVFLLLNISSLLYTISKFVVIWLARLSHVRAEVA